MRAVIAEMAEGDDADFRGDAFELHRGVLPAAGAGGIPGWCVKTGILREDLQVRVDPLDTHIEGERQGS